MLIRLFMSLVMGALTITSPLHGSEAVVSGTLTKWHTVTIDFNGPEASETDKDPNPFLDYRLQVDFTGPTGQVHTVPGFFDGDGKGNATGHVWRVRFLPDEAGTWRYTTSFRAGKQVAISNDKNAGTAVACDGTTGTFKIAKRDPNAPGFLSRGLLEWVGEHYLKFRDDGYWFKAGSNSPENFLAYAGFDDTIPSHRYLAHAEDWRPGDPDWGDGKGKNIIGALNYLASQHVNSLYIMTMNIGGDGKDVWPFVGKIKRTGHKDNDNINYDISKLRQWETVFAHAQRQGIFLHIVLNESENPNKNELDNWTLGTERKLYYREMIARFAHHPAMQWNLCEEAGMKESKTHDKFRGFAGYIQGLDPYDHPICIHNWPNKFLHKAGFTLNDPRFQMTSIQANVREVHQVRQAMAKLGRKLPVCLDESRRWQGGGDKDMRRDVIWRTCMSGGMFEVIQGELLMQETDSFKANRRPELWAQMWNARKFMEMLPFWEMERIGGLVKASKDVKGWQGCAIPFVKPGEVYAVYFVDITPSHTIDLTKATGTFIKRWYHPATGVFDGEGTTISGGEIHTCVTSKRKGEWVLLLTKVKAK